jgi:uncharacterized protein DUF2760
MPLARLVIVLVPGLAVAAANWVVAGMLGPAATCTSCVAWLVAGPVLLALLLVTLLSRASAPPAAVALAPPPPPPAPPREPSELPALRLLGVLQDEGRFVDFLQEDLTPYPDEQIGAAVRGIQEGCRKAVRDHLDIEPVLSGSEGEAVTVEAGFDPAAIRLTGNVTGSPPFRGVLRHPGWRVTRASVPSRRGQDPHLLAPAEVEIP